ncbi:Hypothetical predicted protein [Scomber scombrus]|uniref:Uncharacterized protein n=1 Tax=Scomber scombrus TaxID=13677 RepID=A0AAV1MSU7_SCOSC
MGMGKCGKHKMLHMDLCQQSVSCELLLLKKRHVPKTQYMSDSGSQWCETMSQRHTMQRKFRAKYTHTHTHIQYTLAMTDNSFRYMRCDKVGPIKDLRFGVWPGYCQPLGRKPAFCNRRLQAAEEKTNNTTLRIQSTVQFHFTSASVPRIGSGTYGQIPRPVDLMGIDQTLPGSHTALGLILLQLSIAIYSLEMLINSEKKSLFSHKCDDIALIGRGCVETFQVWTQTQRTEIYDWATSRRTESGPVRKSPRPQLREKSAREKEVNQQPRKDRKAKEMLEDERTRTRDRQNWEAFKTALNSSPSWPGFSALRQLRLHIHTMSPTLNILESIIKANEKSSDPEGPDSSALDS